MSQFQMTFRGMVPSERLRALAESRFLKVTRQCGDMARCHVVIERPAEAAHNGSGFSARVQLHAGSHGVHAAAESEHADASVAVREAFERARAQVATQSARLAHARRTVRRDHLLLLR
jgi:hypothetical protein